MKRLLAHSVLPSSVRVAAAALIVGFMTYMVICVLLGFGMSAAIAASPLLGAGLTALAVVVTGGCLYAHGMLAARVAGLVARPATARQRSVSAWAGLLAVHGLALVAALVDTGNVREVFMVAGVTLVGAPVAAWVIRRGVLRVS